MQQMPLPYQMRSQFGEVSFLKLWKAMEERLAGDQPEHGVSQELEHFIVTSRLTQGLHLARLRAVGESLGQQFRALEVMT
jgi:hypothetical protein